MLSNINNVQYFKIKLKLIPISNQMCLNFKQSVSNKNVDFVNRFP